MKKEGSVDTAGTETLYLKYSIEFSTDTSRWLMQTYYEGFKLHNAWKCLGSDDKNIRAFFQSFRTYIGDLHFLYVINTIDGKYTLVDEVVESRIWAHQTDLCKTERHGISFSDE